jgi:hypothetical protein
MACCGWRAGVARAWRSARIGAAVLCCVWSLPAVALSVEGEAVALGGGRGPADAQRYQFRVDQCASRIRSEWHSANGELLAWDEVEFDAGGRFAAMQGQILPQQGSARHPEPVQATVSVRSSAATSRCHN